MKYIIELPIKLGKFTLNLNQYRNAHYFLLNDSKRNFEVLLRNEISKLPKFNKIHLIYTIYSSTKRKFDISNFGSILDKYFSDALVYFGKLADDSYEYIPQVTFIYGGFNKEVKATVEIISLE